MDEFILWLTDDCGLAPDLARTVGAKVESMVLGERQELRRLFESLGITFGASVGSVTGATVTVMHGDSFTFQVDRNALNDLFRRFNSQSV